MKGTRRIQDLTALDGLAQDCARAVGLAPAIVHLKGPLGVGKTTFVRFWLRHLGLPDTVRSPSFTLIECYDWNGQKIVHTDLFRLRGAREFENLGLRDYVGDALIFIEWPERGEWATPPPDVFLPLNTRKPDAGSPSSPLPCLNLRNLQGGSG
ncbi:Uncharacterized protein family UPF0079, ATPase bacteria domain protein [mine drainage metagenome]|uniref:tRNA threonylcarbamoyladenosine biosynthesis protein TsaE n=1 Tax=mine drainage metagenome TaxID=410659 RepID=T1BHY8_9ZZZZ